MNQLLNNWKNNYYNDLTSFQNYKISNNENPYKATLLYIETTQKLVEDEISNSKLKQLILKFLANEYNYYQKIVERCKK